VVAQRCFFVFFASTFKVSYSEKYGIPCSHTTPEQVQAWLKLPETPELVLDGGNEEQAKRRKKRSYKITLGFIFGCIKPRFVFIAQPYGRAGQQCRVERTRFQTQLSKNYNKQKPEKAYEE
jgi:hypothetical protein